MEVKLFTTGCPRCGVLEKKLLIKNIPFEKITDFNIQELIEKGFKTAPILVVDGKYMDFTMANEWIMRGDNK